MCLIIRAPRQLPPRRRHQARWRPLFVLHCKASLVLATDNDCQATAETGNKSPDFLLPLEISMYNARLRCSV
ncbi:hypothetical protein, partial [Comamonas granuli]|uniref:hypothetical protein n=1 Tax=Comamonas granuli TaxID=290309 RepID=UPI001C3F44B6